MSTRAIVIIISVLALFIIGAPALSIQNSDPSATPPPAVESKHDNSDGKQDDQDWRDKDRRDKIRLEYKARREAERRELYERLREEHYDTCNTGDIVGAALAFATHDEPIRRKFAVGIVYAPANAAKMSGVGIQFINRDGGWGASVWLSGALERADDVIDAPIPHMDYRLQSQQGSYGVEALYSVGSNSASFVVGAGLAVEQTMYAAVSNVTGWRWNHGSDSRVKFAAQVGCSLRLARRLSLSLGYDTHQSAFFGLTGDF
ncbi:MAG: hypothetical protein ACPL7K_03140 [Armatimonadota bacterium]